MKKLAIISIAVAAATASHAVTWTVTQFPAGPAGVNATAFTTLGSSTVDLTLNTPAVGSNAITLLTPSANFIGPGIRQYSWQYRAGLSDALLTMHYSISGSVFGNASIQWEERVFGIDALGNEVPIDQQSPTFFGAGGTINTTNTPGNVFGLNGSFNMIPNSFTQIVVKKSFILFAPDAQSTASVNRVNQSLTVVPEPMTMTALGLGLAAVAARRRKKA